MPFPLDPSQLSGVANVTISGNTTYTTQAQRVQIAGTFLISGAFTLTAREGLLILCNTFQIDNASGVLTSAGVAGAAPVAQTGGVGGANGATALASSGGSGASGVATGNNGSAGTTPGAITIAANTVDLTADTQAQEESMLRSRYYAAAFPQEGIWGLGGRGGGCRRQE